MYMHVFNHDCIINTHNYYNYDIFECYYNHGFMWDLGLELGVDFLAGWVVMATLLLHSSMLWVALCSYFSGAAVSKLLIW